MAVVFATPPEARPGISDGWKPSFRDAVAVFTARVGLALQRPPIARRGSHRKPLAERSSAPAVVTRPASARKADSGSR